MRKQPMNESQSLSHTVWDCKYHIVWIQKYRKKSLYKGLRKYVGPVLRDLASRKECKIEEGYMMSDHVHVLISIPPKYSVSQVIGFIKGKSAISIARMCMELPSALLGDCWRLCGQSCLRSHPGSGLSHGCR